MSYEMPDFFKLVHSLLEPMLGWNYILFLIKIRPNSDKVTVSNYMES